MIINSNSKVAGNNNYVIAIGASAGGLEAINNLFDNIPEHTGFSYIIIQHLSPDYKSLMGELLSKHTSMQVFEATDGMVMESNCVYLLPAKKTMTLKDGMLWLKDKEMQRQPNNAIDIFFESLAEDKKDKAIAIILSGTGTDGTKGIEAIKKNKGLVIVQDPITAEFDGMPNSAISTGYADLILAPDMMPDEMIEYLREVPLIRAYNRLNHKEELILMEILDLVNRVTAHDFTNYKRPTIARRLAKRMAEKNFRSMSEYHEYLKTHADEVKMLCREFLINVTRFFRDEEAFDTLSRIVIPELFKNKAADHSLKIWVVACSTGEEAYSIAMLLMQHMEANQINDMSAKIFATDIDQEAVDVASKGIYSEAAVKCVPPDKLKRYFTREGNSYKVSSSLRKMVVFAKHDILKDPPFSRIDLLSCRNMLIYMTPLLQKSILQKFHFSLNEDGFIFMGPSENIGVLREVMKDVEKKWKIYKCISKAKAGEAESYLNPLHKGNYVHLPVTSKSKNALSNIAEIFKETILDEYEYAGIYIDKDFEVKQAVGSFKKFISFPEGNFNFNLLKLVPADLSVALSTCIRKAIKTNEKVVMKKIKITEGMNVREVSIIVKPYLVQKVYMQPFLFIVLNEEQPEARSLKIAMPKDRLDVTRIEELEIELRDTKENLQAVIEEVESANEELQSTNEEIISSNEELQSTNEELQSLNEELHTVNAEHQLKIRELIELNDDMNNYFRNTDIGQIFIDSKMMIRKFSPASQRQVNLINSDIGRSITDISVNFKALDFINDIKKVIRTGELVEKEIVMDDGHTFLMRITQYVRQDKTVDGVVVNFINISETKRLNSLIGAIFNASVSAITAQKVIKDSNNKVTDLQFIAANDTIYKLFGHTSHDLIGQSIYKAFPEFMDKHGQAFLDVVASGGTRSFQYYDVPRSTWLEVVIVKMVDGVVTTFTDISLQKKSFQELQDALDMLGTSNTQLEQSNYDLLQFASVASHDLKEPLRKIQTYGNKLREKAGAALQDTELGYLQKMISASNRMQVLIEDILMLSKLSVSKIPHVQVDLNEVIADIIDDLEITIKEKNVDFRIGQLPVLNAVQGQMHQLFQNLISNSIKFNENKPPVIVVSAGPVPQELAVSLGIEGSKYKCITLADNGIGFDEEYREKIFGVFQRLNGANYPGTGIGLAICKKIVDNHNGFIVASSQPGKGAAFTIVLPE